MESAVTYTGYLLFWLTALNTMETTAFRCHYASTGMILEFTGYFTNFNGFRFSNFRIRKVRFWNLLCEDAETSSTGSWECPLSFSVGSSDRGDVWQLSSCQVLLSQIWPMSTATVTPGYIACQHTGPHTDRLTSSSATAEGPWWWPETFVATAARQRHVVCKGRRHKTSL